MLPAPFATNHVQGPKYEKTNAKMMVPIKKTNIPIRLNLTNLNTQVRILFRISSLTTDLLISDHNHSTSKKFQGQP